MSNVNTARDRAHFTSQTRADTYRGRTVQTTDGRTGVVKYAYNWRGVINLTADGTDGRTQFSTSSEYATIVRVRLDKR